MQKLRFHHVGIPTTAPLPGRLDPGSERRDFGYFDNPYGMEWHNFADDSPLPEIIRTRPHVAFVVDDLAQALVGKEVVLEPTSPADGVTVAFILDRGVLVELLQFHRPEQEVWPHPSKFQIG